MAFPPERAANPERGRHLSFPPPPQPPPHLSSPPREPTPLLVRTIAPASRAPGVSDDGTWCGQLTYTSDRFCRVLVPSRFLVSFLVHPSSLCALPLPSLSPPPLHLLSVSVSVASLLLSFGELPAVRPLNFPFTVGHVESTCVAHVNKYSLSRNKMPTLSLSWPLIIIFLSPLALFLAVD